MKLISRMEQHNPDFYLAMGIILFAVITRLTLPPLLNHPPNFSPIDAIALLCGAYFHKRATALLVTLLSVWVGDLLIDRMLLGHWMLFYPGFYWQYASYCLMTFIGSALAGKHKWQRLPFACLATASIFFAISNFGVWQSGFLYPHTIDGLITCYVAAIPFFKNTVLSDLFFSLILFVSVSNYVIGRVTPV